MRISTVFIYFCFISIVPICSHSQTNASPVVSKQKQALAFLKQTTLSASSQWTSVSQQLFLQNLERNIEQPVFLYAGRNTNFCAFAAVGYVMSRQDPLGYVKFMISLYKNGKAEYAGVMYKPSDAVRKQVGLVLYEGELDRNDADQMLFFTLADHFKGYINLFHLRYKEGRELGLWAATNLSKFNDMLRVTMKAEIQSRGYDLTRLKLKQTVQFLQEKLEIGDVFLYLNNAVLRRKNHGKVKKHIPTHFVILKSLTEENGIVTMTYWDAGFTTLRQIELSTFKRLLYGVSWSVRNRK
ncbi:hypothetical protein [Lacibacter sediminis]|uniref:Uncharacterized protein n=1 Tax=Lacibacter sediminis TaxID=2760713 RepID=A0A7G5XM21_9BACT|nr:hypothetical protein [Lacibacter sediminis]QNA46524.1 hypothetical protein H4075_10240 [Lacibacter sediminis]